MYSKRKLAAFRSSSVGGGVPKPPKKIDPETTQRNILKRAHHLQAGTHKFTFFCIPILRVCLDEVVDFLSVQVFSKSNPSV